MIHSSPPVQNLETSCEIYSLVYRALLQHFESWLTAERNLCSYQEAKGPWWRKSHLCHANDIWVLGSQPGELDADIHSVTCGVQTRPAKIRQPSQPLRNSLWDSNQLRAEMNSSHFSTGVANHRESPHLRVWEISLRLTFSIPMVTVSDMLLGVFWPDVRVCISCMGCMSNP